MSMSMQGAWNVRDLATLLFWPWSQNYALGSQNIKNLTIDCVQAVWHSFFQIYFIFSA